MKKAKTSYIKLVRLLIKNNKLLYSLSLFTLIFGFSFSCVFFSISGAIIDTKQKSTVKTYGKFLVVISDISNEHASEIKTSIPDYDYKQFQILGNLTYQDTKITYGYTEQKMGDYLGFKLICGTWPSAAEQIVIEEYLATKLGLDKLPCFVDMFIEDTKKTYEITGIISNYSCNLSVDVNRSLNTNVYPSAIYGGEFDDKAGISLVVSQKNLNFKTADNDIWDFLSKYRKLPSGSNNLSLNEKLTWHGFDDLKDIINSRVVHSLLLYIFMLITEIIIIRSFMLKNKNTFYIFKALGLSARENKILMIRLISFFLVSALALSYLMVYSVGLAYINQTFSEYKEAFSREILKYFTIQLITVFLLLFGFIIIIIMSEDLQIMEGIKFVKKRNSNLKFKKININTVFMYTVLLFCIIASMNFMTMFKTDLKIEYSLYSKKTFSSENIGTYNVALYQDRYFPFSVLDTLKKYSKYISISTEGEALQFSILFEKGKTDPYFKNLIDSDTRYSSKNEDKIFISGEAAKYTAVPVNQISIQVLPDKELNEFMKKHDINLSYSEPDSLTDKNLSCILIVPNYDGGHENAVIKEKGYINIGGINKINDEFSFHIEKFKVEKLITPVTSQSMPIQMVISEETAKKSSSILGYNIISVTVKDDTPEDLLYEIDNIIYSIAASVQGGMLGSTLKEATDNKLLKNYTGLLSNTIIIFCIMSVIIYINLSTFVNWENNKHEYGVLRSFGMSYHILQHKLFMQFTISILCSTVIASLLGYLAFPGKYGMTPGQVAVSLFTSLIVTYFCRIILYFIYKKQTISSMVNDA
ncbi:FtsX-like permease family protein [Herbinix hemicellulosilytica]|uniref:FtsX-like permease family protein n=1 Tax=Herbinix hemicellulosilytica TaxID=1564487 RepID=UPI000CD25831|nr:FtsX-like permease family protein [Herbinix hemicellulosilytica]